MKYLNSFILIVLAFPAAIAHAEEGTISIGGAKAGAVMQALQKAGAHEEIVPEIVHLKTQRVACYEAFRFGFGQYYQCIFEQLATDPPSTIIYTKQFKVLGQKAREIIFALRDAGVKGEPVNARTTYTVSSISCEGRYFGMSTTEQCTLGLE